jgi:hypothetical protein
MPSARRLDNAPDIVIVPPGMAGRTRAARKPAPAPNTATPQKEKQMTQESMPEALMTPSRRRLLALAAGGGLGLSLLSGTGAQAEDDRPMLMFVQLASGTVVDDAARTIRLVNLSPQTLYFSDRPDRIAGHVKLDRYLADWTAAAGADNFGADPPNAALSVYEAGKQDSSVSIIEISNPRVEGADILYDYKVIRDAGPVSGGETALFIDMIGVGGGVGVGFHGVGVGVRGPGVY